MQNVSHVNRPVKDAAAYYDSLARWYDLLAGSEKRFIRAGLDLLAPSPGERILEIGFGTGYAQERIARALKGGFSVGVDLSPKMAEITSQKLREADKTTKVGLVCSDSLPLPFAGSSFEGLFSSFTLELFDTPLLIDLLGECRRVLTPGGRIVVVSLSKDLPLPWMGRLYEALHNRWPRLLDCRPIPVKGLLESNKFKVVEEDRRMMWGLPVILVAAAPLA